MRSGTFLGFPYTVHPVWLLVFAILLVSLVTSLSGSATAQLSTPAALVVGSLVVALFVISIVAHELSHAVMTRRLGLPGARIQLATIGRPVESEPDPIAPGGEFVVAVAGPVLSAIVGLLLVAAASVVPTGSDEAVLAVYWSCLWLGLANLVLAAFHLVPVLPLDGGRIVRAGVWTLTRDLDRASATTAFVGRMFGYLVIGGGLFLAMSIDIIFGLWMVLLGWFTTRLARGSLDRRRMERLTQGLTVADATDTDPATIPPSLAVATLLREDEEQGGQGVYPVVEGEILLGVVFTSRLRRPFRRPPADERVRDVLIPIERAPSLEANEPLMRAVERLELTRGDGLPVLSRNDPGRVFGVLTRARVLDRLRARQLVEDRTPAGHR